MLFVWQNFLSWYCDNYIKVCFCHLNIFLGKSVSLITRMWGQQNNGNCQQGRMYLVTEYK